MYWMGEMKGTEAKEVLSLGYEQHLGGTAVITLSWARLGRNKFGWRNQ